VGLNCGIVGLPNVGKTTIFSALTSQKAVTTNYPFSTKDPNIGMVQLPDERLLRISAIHNPKKTTPAVVEFVDIAGLVKGASKGEGMGNQFLSHIREVGIIVHVVRCFEDPDIVHVSDRIDPANDIDIINTELALADLETVDKRLEKLVKQVKVQNPAQKKEAEREKAVLEKIREVLQEGKPARALGLGREDAEAVRNAFLITMKRQIYVCNVDEEGIRKGSRFVDAVKARAAEEGSEAVTICGKFEAELAELGSEDDRKAFLEELGLHESGLSALIHGAFRLLGLRTFFTSGEDECRAWTFHEGDTAPTTAAVIHTDFEKGFIKAEVYSYEDLAKYGSEAKVKEAGKFRIEGREYLVKDGDIMFFRFNL
jgi:GTP-binding protein YchF